MAVSLEIGSSHLPCTNLKLEYSDVSITRPPLVPVRSLNSEKVDLFNEH